MRRLRPLFLLTLLAPGLPSLVGCDSQQPGICPASDATFEIDDITPEDATLGAIADPGSCVTVNYVGRLADGSGTFDEGEGLDFFVGTGRGQRLITGFVLGVNNQQVGQTRRVTMPPNFAYGIDSTEARSGFVGGGDSGEAYVGIPSCSVLEFDITLVRVNEDTRICSGV